MNFAKTLRRWTLQWKMLLSLDSTEEPPDPNNLKKHATAESSGIVSWKAITYLVISLPRHITSLEVEVHVE